MRLQHLALSVVLGGLVVSASSGTASASSPGAEFTARARLIAQRVFAAPDTRFTKRGVVAAADGLQALWALPGVVRVVRPDGAATDYDLGGYGSGPDGLTPRPRDGAPAEDPAARRMAATVAHGTTFPGEADAVSPAPGYRVFYSEMPMVQLTEKGGRKRMIVLEHVGLQKNGRARLRVYSMLKPNGNGGGVGAYSYGPGASRLGIIQHSVTRRGPGFHAAGFEPVAPVDQTRFTLVQPRTVKGTLGRAVLQSMTLWTPDGGYTTLDRDGSLIRSSQGSDPSHERSRISPYRAQRLLKQAYRASKPRRGH